jgi:eukaryotic-like serine/threonine-protein kinase
MGVPRPLREGEEVAPGYRALRLLRRGEALDVYDAWSEERDCRCVAKALRPDKLSERSARAALLREGELLLSLSHPHLVRAYELLRGRRPVLILETLTGATLARLIEDSPRGIPERSLVFLGVQLCSALRYLHRHGFLHLDLKPSNIVSQAGVAKLLDLSVARPPGRPHRGVGTPQYMSPEQITGAPLTAAADAWGLGAVLYEAATGTAPFARRGAPRPPRLAQKLVALRRRRKVPRVLGEVIDGCLEKEPSARPALAEVAAALRTLV